MLKKNNTPPTQLAERNTDANTSKAPKNDRNYEMLSISHTTSIFLFNSIIEHIVHYLSTTYRFSSQAPVSGVAQHPFLSLQVRIPDPSIHSSSKPSDNHPLKKVRGRNTRTR